MTNSPSHLPRAGSVAKGNEKARENARRLIAERGLTGAANNTQWNELIDFMRTRSEWRPSWRYKWVNGFVSGWDVEWFYHLPFAFVGVEWFDIGLVQEIHRGRLLSPERIDHGDWILPKLAEIGFDIERRGDIARIWGYLPRCTLDFTPTKS
ncbi:MAG: hypothetical protein RL095_1875 [Verrucomicrobiota bacterium]|jgi:hypothetical protein